MGQIPDFHSSVSHPFFPSRHRKNALILNRELIYVGFSVHIYTLSCGLDNFNLNIKLLKQIFYIWRRELTKLSIGIEAGIKSLKVNLKDVILYTYIQSYCFI